MIEIWKKSELARLRETYGFAFSKELGQNFLADRNVAEKIADACAGGGVDVIEIGAGAGALTVHLAARARKVFAVELDARVIPLLAAVCEGLENVVILHEDFLKIEPDRLSERYVLAGNLPYQITTHVITTVMEGLHGGFAGAACSRPPEGRPPLQAMVFMVQKEVADRLLAARPERLDLIRDLPSSVRLTEAAQSRLTLTNPTARTARL
ncbi:MAG: hypothetical protein LBR00_06540, partial [Clostridiales Family XIII bacterium]|nr:hypothetical protein [Clostridiales Family XIII bacterium]